MSAIGARQGELWMLHAAGVALPDGRVVVFIGPSGRGKTTAARHLGAAYGYVSDETVGIDEAGRVWPYRKPLSIIEDNPSVKVQRAPSEIGLMPLPDGELRLAAVVLLDRRPDAPDEPVIETVDLGDALEELAAQSSYLMSMPAPLQTIAGHVASVGGVQRVTYREASSLVPLVPGLAEPTPQAAAAPPRSQVREGGKPGTYRRAEVHDALVFDDSIAVFQKTPSGRGMLRIIAGIAPAIWRAADGASFDDLVAAAVADHGDPDAADSATLVRAALDELIVAELIESC